MPRSKPWLARRHPAKELAVLVGRWDAEATFPGTSKSMRGTATFRWFAKNALLIMRSRMRRPIPTSISVIGADDVNGTYTMLYSDDRGVTREYKMKLTRTTLTFERRAPKFSQRFIGRFSANRRVIRGAWEQSPDGRRWKHDFALVYTKKR